MFEPIELWTDGSHDNYNNSSIGAYAFLTRIKGKEVNRFSQALKETGMSSDRMELKAILEALKSVKNPMNKEIIVYSDAKYILNGIGAIKNAEARGWKTKNDNKNYTNLDLWLEISQFLKETKFKIKFQWVKGHNGHIEWTPNVVVDELACQTRREMETECKKKKIDTRQIVIDEREMSTFEVIINFIENMFTKIRECNIINI